jgi:hypothetical protein
MALPLLVGAGAVIGSVTAWITKKIAVSVIGTAIQGFLTGLYIVALGTFIYFFSTTLVDFVNLIYSLVDLLNPTELASQTGTNSQTLVCIMSATECLGVNHGLRIGLNLFISNILIVLLLNTYKIPLYFIKNLSTVIGGTINAAK